MTGQPTARGAATAIAATDSVRQAISAISSALRAAGIDDGEKDARYIVQGILGLDAADIVRDPDRPVGAFATQLGDAVRRRLSDEPVSRILGKRDFYGRTFKVTPDVLDPRADTETLIDLVLDIVRAEPRLQRAITIADIGSGSGAIIVTLLAELPSAHGIAIDVSPAALAVTLENAHAHGVAGRMTTVASRGLQGITQPLDLVVSNPPYIVTHDIDGLDPSVRHFDPRLALDGGTDGLQIYREIAIDIKALSNICWVALEFGAGQDAEVMRIFSALDVQRTILRPDLGGHMRAVALEIHR